MSQRTMQWIRRISIICDKVATMNRNEFHIFKLQNNGFIKAFDEGGKEFPHLKSLTVRVYRGDCRHLTPWAWNVSEFDVSEFI